MRNRINCQQPGSSWRLQKLITSSFMMTKGKSKKACASLISARDCHIIWCINSLFRCKAIKFISPNLICCIYSSMTLCRVLYMSVFVFLCPFLYFYLLIPLWFYVSVRAVEVKCKTVHRIEEQLMKLHVQATDREENKQIALGTSKLNYLDPRISVAWYLFIYLFTHKKDDYIFDDKFHYWK